jgi:hypothetical protein
MSCCNNYFPNFRHAKKYDGWKGVSRAIRRHDSEARRSGIEHYRRFGSALIWIGRDGALCPACFGRASQLSWGRNTPKTGGIIVCCVSNQGMGEKRGWSCLQFRSMRSVYLILTLLVCSCASQNSRPLVSHKPAPVVSQRVEAPPSVCDTLVSAINRGDWPALKAWAKPGTTTNDMISTWQKAAESGHPVQVGKFLNAQTVGGSSQKPFKLYSFSMENKDGTVNPHWLQIKVRLDDGKAEIVDFWNFGW